MKKLHIETQLLHSEYSPDKGTGATALPVFQSTAFARESAEEMESVFAGKDAGFIYSRINNPTLDRFERMMTGLESGLISISCASGMSAISTTVLALVESGDEIISGSSIFGGTYSLFSTTLKRYGITTRFVESNNPDAFRNSVTDKTKMIFVETIGNPKLAIPDISAISEIAREHGIVLVVDNTATTPVLCQAKELGADIVVQSTSKYINGHGNSIGGIITDCGTFDWSNEKYPDQKQYHDKVRKFAFAASLRNRIHRDLGGCFSPFNAFLMSIGLESLALRMERHCSNALRVAEKLTTDSRVESATYPGLSEHPDHAIASKQFKNGYGGILTLRLGSKERCFKFINGLKLAGSVANLGDAKTLVIHPASTFCREASQDERKAMGAEDDLVRISVGIENIDDILADIDSALEQI